MNKLSFLDELLRCTSFAPIVKQAYADYEANTIDAPAGMMDSTQSPPQIATVPDEASSRLQDTAHLPAAIKPGQLGAVTDAKAPIDQERFNRPYDAIGHRR